MLRNTLLFFKTERKYFWLLLGVLLFYTFVFFGPRLREHAPKHLKQVEKFKEAEKKWNEGIDHEGAFSAFAKRQPLLAGLFGLLTVFFIFAMLAGLIIDFLFLWKPAFRAKWMSSLSPPEFPSWRFSILFKVVILFFVGGIVLGLLTGILEAIFPGWASANFYMILHTLILNILCLLLMIKFVKQAGGKWQDLGFNFRKTDFFREAGIGVVSYLGVLPLFGVVLAVLLVVAQLAHYEPPPHPLVDVFLTEEKGVPFLVVLSILLGTVIGPIFEEIFFRGFCYPILRNKWGKVWGMVLSAAFFAGIHHSGFVFWPIFILGIALAYVYEKRRSLIASMALHITHNTIFISYFFLVKQIVGGKIS